MSTLRSEMTSEATDYLFSLCIMEVNHIFLDMTVGSSTSRKSTCLYEEEEGAVDVIPNWNDVSGPSSWKIGPGW